MMPSFDVTDGLVVVVLFRIDRCVDSRSHRFSQIPLEELLRVETMDDLRCHEIRTVLLDQRQHEETVGFEVIIDKGS